MRVIEGINAVLGSNLKSSKNNLLSAESGVLGAGAKQGEGWNDG
jgi:hypothetical protein